MSDAHRRVDVRDGVPSCGSAGIETARLTLRRIALADAPFVLRLFNEPSFIQHIGDKGIRTLEDARSYIATGPAESYHRHGFGLYVTELKATATPIGVCGLLKRDWLHDVDLGFAFLPEYRSMGYAFEAASAVVGYARGTFGLLRIVAITAPDNAAAHRLLGRLGFRLERLVRPPDEEQDISLFAL